MAGTRLDVAFDDAGTTRRLNQLLARLDDPKPLFNDIGEYLLQSHDDRWDQQQAPDGSAWKPLSEKYAARKERKRPNAGILTYDELLRRLVYQASDSGLELGTNRIYGATQQFGDPDRNIPARPFLGLSGEDETEIAAIVEDYLDQALA